jgi:hypothetical protein
VGIPSSAILPPWLILAIMSRNAAGLRLGAVTRVPACGGSRRQDLRR